MFLATDYKAAAGQAENQSKAQQSTIEGNFLVLILKASPTGDMQRIIWRFFLTSSTKVLYKVSGSSALFNF